MSITTGYGDEGATRLLSGERVWKNDPRIEALGDIDELICLLGEARARIAEREHAGMILDMQRAVMRVAAEVASTSDASGSGQDTINSEDIAVIEARQRQLESESGDLPSGFVLPGGSPAGAALDHSRAVARRVERRLVSLRRSDLQLADATLTFMNRLSDILWVLARREEPLSTVAG